jgi:RNA polymerase sigma-70 factor (ECF subfamily)
LIRKKPAESDSFVKQLEPLQRALEAYCRRSLRDVNEVADVLQAAVGKAFRDYHEFAQGTNFRAWIFRYVCLEVLNRNRAAGRTRPVGLLTDLPDDNATNDLGEGETLASFVLTHPERILDGCDDQLAEGIGQMPPLERSILLLRAIGEFRYREIAEILSVPMGTVMGLLARGRSRLRAQLAEYAKKQGWLPGQEGE